MEVNGRDDLKAPLLQLTDGVAITVPEQKCGREKKVKTTKFKIGDVKCASCATSIESVLGKFDGVEIAVVSPLDGHAAISYIPELITDRKIKEITEAAGFPVDEFPEQEISVCWLRIKEMCCV